MAPRNDPTATGRATAADQRAFKQRARAANDAQANAYKAGRGAHAEGYRAGEAPSRPGSDKPEEQGAFDQGHADAKRETAPHRRAASAVGARFSSAKSGASGRVGDATTNAASRGGELAADGAGLVLGLVVYALAMAYIRNGRAGVTTWLRAKFFNEPGSLGPQAGIPLPGSSTLPAPNDAASRSQPQSVIDAKAAQRAAQQGFSAMPETHS